ncbi:MAG: GTP-binding protein LepA, GTP-binding protein LepA [candidate division Kazan bacterium GW2011_GWA1_50_15]|uniref:Elongation factor 4 n=2 Tax=Bacteria division Kazan-3B-28 TaxID=1798534 RepID=A0A0G2A427_UNCK3|nr:MAG: GTP-binding protein LepA, GTP-binding protein LepA [candidate division Kazan bacterium GW2011_GWA1_50_15]KKW25679.1 MAG: Elongation factor 4 [candidate division Kazan bacterium GW2011_GWC1_52_13]KKW26984.1 MAG: Elongation factor 4 [candidate division Kazan bacterium GW2011_GWB1_52_7]HAV66028.1 elongation factor 4 [Patescibacteria group bacterium]HCR42596.1 elongation factor 4 [Patescibacteria group bacterium]
MEKIRNFCVIAHIDHGKSTLADRLLELTNTISSREMRAQYLDTMDLERERGITIKLQPVRMTHKGFELNLIDTPGHVDFSYEVSRSLAAVEGALLVVDASQGIEAQTLANLHLAKEQGLTIIPVINKIDLPVADVQRVSEEMKKILEVTDADILKVSAKTGEGVEKILDAIVERVPAPTGNINAPLRALVFDSYFDAFKGVVTYIRVVDGSVGEGKQVRMMASNATAETLEVGFFAPKLTKRPELATGEIGYLATGLKDVRSVRVGDTVTLAKPALNDKLKMTNEKLKEVEALPGYKQVMPFVYAGIFTVDNADFPELREALDKLQLNDSSLAFEPENSPALGFGFRCGFLGLLHMDIVQERLEREFNLNLVTTTPSVSYEVVLTSGQTKIIHNPTELPAANFYKTIAEPWIKLDLVMPVRYMGGVMQLVQDLHGVQQNVQYLDAERVLLTYEIPLSSVVVNFYDKLKSVSSGYASMAYEFIGFKVGELVKVDMLVNERPVDTLSVIVHKKEAQKIGWEVATKLKDLMPKQNFKIVIQAAIGGKVIAREELSPYRKDVLAKLYGGDRTRKDKLLAKQAKGKKRMKMVGQVELPQSVFRNILS